MYSVCVVMNSASSALNSLISPFLASNKFKLELGVGVKCFSWTWRSFTQIMSFVSAANYWQYAIDWLIQYPGAQRTLSQFIITVGLTSEFILGISAVVDLYWLLSGKCAELRRCDQWGGRIVSETARWNMTHRIGWMYRFIMGLLWIGVLLWLSRIYISSLYQWDPQNQKYQYFYQIYHHIVTVHHYYKTNHFPTGWLRLIAWTA